MPNEGHGQTDTRRVSVGAGGKGGRCTVSAQRTAEMDGPLKGIRPDGNDGTKGERGVSREAQYGRDKRDQNSGTAPTMPPSGLRRGSAASAPGPARAGPSQANHSRTGATVSVMPKVTLASGSVALLGHAFAHLLCCMFHVRTRDASQCPCYGTFPFQHWRESGSV